MDMEQKLRDMNQSEEIIEQFFSSIARILNYENNRSKPASMMDHGLHFYVYSFKIERTDISKLEKTSKMV